MRSARRGLPNDPLIAIIQPLIKFLGAPNAGIDASLHRFADSTILEGFWRNGRERGFWRLHLPLETVMPRETRVVKLPAGARKRRATGTRNARKRVRRAA